MTELHDTIIFLENACRRFGRRDALKNIDLQVRPGTMLGLIGPNGSGKTTLLKLLAGFIKTTSGTVRMFGYDPFTHRTQVMRRARFAFAPPPVYGALSAFEHLKFLSAAGVPQIERSGHSEIVRALETVGLAHRAHDKTATFSFGMKQRLGLAQALLPLPELLVFDEPTDGLDPLAVAELRGTLKRLQTEYGLTVVLSSHLLSEVEKLVDTLLALNEGGVIYCGTPAGLLEGGRRIEMRIEGELEAGIRALRRQGFNPEMNGGNCLILPAGSIRLHEAASLLQKQGLRLIDFHEKRPRLADAYLQRLKDDAQRPQIQGRP